MVEQRKRVALSIGGSDSFGGAGVQADLKTFEFFDVYGMSALTLVTAQNSVGVHHVELLSAETVRAQLLRILEDVTPDVIKVGAVGGLTQAEAVADVLESLRGIPIVVDPVMVSKHGHRLLEPEVEDVVRTRLVPCGDITTPNMHEAGVLLSRKVADVDDMRVAAGRIAREFGTASLVTGGALDQDQLVDVFAWNGDVRVLTGMRHDTPNVHGSGCTLAAAIAAGLAKSAPLRDAVDFARQYTSRAIAEGPAIGSRLGPLSHFPRDIGPRPGRG